MSLWMNPQSWMSMEDLVIRGESQYNIKSIHIEPGFQLSASSRWVIDQITSSQACPRCSPWGRSPKFKRLGLPKPFLPVHSLSLRETSTEESDHRSNFQTASSNTHSKSSLSWVRPKQLNNKELLTVAALRAERDPTCLEAGKTQISRAWRKSKRCSPSTPNSQTSWVRCLCKMKFHSSTTSWWLAQVPTNSELKNWWLPLLITRWHRKDRSSKVWSCMSPLKHRTSTARHTQSTISKMASITSRNVKGANLNILKSSKTSAFQTILAWSKPGTSRTLNS